MWLERGIATLTHAFTQSLTYIVFFLNLLLLDGLHSEDALVYFIELQLHLAEKESGKGEEREEREGVTHERFVSR